MLNHLTPLLLWSANKGLSLRVPVHEKRVSAYPFPVHMGPLLGPFEAVLLVADFPGFDRIPRHCVLVGATAEVLTITECHQECLDTAGGCDAFHFQFGGFPPCRITLTAASPTASPFAAESCETTVAYVRYSTALPTADVDVGTFLITRTVTEVST